MKSHVVAVVEADGVPERCAELGILADFGAYADGDGDAEREALFGSVGDAERAELAAERRACGGAIGVVELGLEHELAAFDDAVVDAERGG